MRLLDLRALSVPIAFQHMHVSDPIKNWDVRRARVRLYIAGACCVCRLPRSELILGKWCLEWGLEFGSPITLTLIALSLKIKIKSNRSLAEYLFNWNIT